MNVVAGVALAVNVVFAAIVTVVLALEVDAGDVPLFTVQLLKL